MTVSNTAYLKGFYDASRAMGAKVVSSDFAFEIEGFEGNWLLCKQAPWPEISPAGEIEVPTPLGATMWQPQPSKARLCSGQVLVDSCSQVQVLNPVSVYLPPRQKMQEEENRLRQHSLFDITPQQRDQK